MIFDKIPKEATINALIHKDYTNTSNLQIKIFENRLIMYNGEALSNEVPIEQSNKPHQSKLFSLTMASIFCKWTAAVASFCKTNDLNDGINRLLVQLEKQGGYFVK